MKQIIFMLLLVIDVSLIFGQCSCCGSSSNISAGEATPMSYSLGKRQLLGEIYSDNRFFSPVVEENSPGHHAQTNSVLGINNMIIAIVGLRYGINSRTGLSVQQPYIFINGVTTSSKALGDLLSLVNYVALRKEDFTVNVQAGMEWPTGEYRQVGNGNAVSAGSGSFDPVIGLNGVKFFTKASLGLNTFFKYTTNGFNGMNYGKFFGHQISFSYSVLNSEANCGPDSLSKKSKSKPTLSINAQLSGEWLQMQMKQYAILENTGGYSLLGGLGVTLAFNGFAVPVIVTVPVCQYMYGDQNRNTIRFRIGLTKTIN